MRNLSMQHRFFILLFAGILALSGGLHAQSHKPTTPSCKDLLESDSTAFRMDFRPYSFDSARGLHVHHIEAALCNEEEWKDCSALAFSNSSQRDILWHIQGKSIYRLKVEADGRVSKMCYVKMPHPLIDATFRDCIRKLEFVPAGSPEGKVSSWTTFPFSIGKAD